MQDRVLLLEDSPELADALELLLTTEGYAVTVTDSGTEALVLFARSYFDLVLADVQVRDLGGPAVWTVIRDLSEVPVIAMSAAPSGWQANALRSGVSACLAKPFDIDELLGLMRALLRAPAEGPTPDVEALSEEDLRRVRSLGTDELDALPYGLIRLDRQGVVVGYNAFESHRSGRSAEDVIGRPFADVAPCVRVQEFVAAVDESRRDPTRSPVLRFRFPHRGATAIVNVRVFHDTTSDQDWLFVSRRPDA